MCAQNSMLPGYDIVGRAVCIIPPVSSNWCDFIFDDDSGKKISVTELPGKEFTIRVSQDVIDAAGPVTGLNSTYHSWDELAKEYGVNIGPIKIASLINLTFSQLYKYKSTRDAWYALRTFNSPFCELRLKHDSKLRGINKDEIPLPFDKNRIEEYLRFFTTRGTHYVTSAVVGASLVVAFINEQFKQVAERSFNVAVGAVFSGIVNGIELNDSQKRQISQALEFTEIKFVSLGANPAIAGKFLNLGESLQSGDFKNANLLFNEWCQSNADYFDVLEYRVNPIWDLFNDYPDVADTLREAYKYIFGLSSEFTVGVLTRSGRIDHQTSGEWVGTKGRSLPLSGFRINSLSKADDLQFIYDGTFRYDDERPNYHRYLDIKGIKNNQWCGITIPEPNPPKLEVMSIRLNGTLATLYDVCYQAHISNQGDSKIYRSGNPIYAFGEHIESIRVWLESKLYQVSDSIRLTKELQLRSSDSTES
jgi:hypothetical protein